MRRGYRACTGSSTTSSAVSTRASRRPAIFELAINPQMSRTNRDRDNPGVLAAHR